MVADQRASGATRDQTQAYAATHAGLEKLTSDLGQLFTGGNFSPSAQDLDQLEAAPPLFSGFSFEGPGGAPGYQLTQMPTVTEPIAAGPYQGLVGLITPYQVEVTARSLGAEVRMRREVQSVAVPVFQFGLYSENDLSFFAGPNFNFGGRIHTNQNLYLAQGGSNKLKLDDRVTAVGEVVRTHLSNRMPISASGHRGHVEVAKAPGVFRRLKCGSMGGNCGSAQQEGSATIVGDTIPPSIPQVGPEGEIVMTLQPPNTENEPTWTNLSMGTYAGYIRNGRTGARRLDLPLVSEGAAPIDIIRRPDPANPDTQTVLDQRFFSMASLRVLLSDTAADVTALPTVTAAAPIELGRLNDPAYRATIPGLAFPHPAAEAGPYSADPTLGKGYGFPDGSASLTGFLKIERQGTDEAWQDVTAEILSLGFTGRSISGSGTFNLPENPGQAANLHCLDANENPSPNAIIRLQRVRDNPEAGTAPCGVDGGGNWSVLPRDYLPLTLYDPREGARRDDQALYQPGGVSTPPMLGGVMHYVEFDVDNYRRWLNGAIGTSGPGSMDVTGYVVYFSDRRGNRNVANVETGEFGFEDFINTDSLSTPNGALDPGEDMNGNGTVETYGGTPRMPVVNGVGHVPTGVTAIGAAATLTTAVSPSIARVNPPIFFRRALKLVNGARGQLPFNGLQGLTVASENPAYIQGNYNADGGGFGPTGDGHVSAAVIADAVTVLSNSFNDITSFVSPHRATDRNGTTTWYRLAIIAGKGLSFPRPSNNSGDHTDYGTDGGAHNFIRFIEDWGGQSLNYRGSLVSFYTSRQAMGTYKCCNIVYRPPSRQLFFDTELLTPNLLPPRTPMFRDINTLTFRQLLRPTQ